MNQNFNNNIMHAIRLSQKCVKKTTKVVIDIKK